MINVAFGLKAYLTNDMGFSPPDIVIDMVECNGTAGMQKFVIRKIGVCVKIQNL